MCMARIKSLKIQSISDIITNSSDETFVVIEKDCVDNIHTILSNIVKQFNPELEFDDMFTIELDYDKTWLDEQWDKIHRLKYGYKTDDEKAWIINDELISDGDNYPLITGITIVARNSWNNDLAELFTAITNNQFSTTIIYR